MNKTFRDLYAKYYFYKYQTNINKKIPTVISVDIDEKKKTIDICVKDTEYIDVECKSISYSGNGTVIYQFELEKIKINPFTKQVSF